ncbi:MULTISPECIES: hydantoinase/oxoprolinase family protein [Paenibacillus]|uniref:hydantoinase/oxoprolinase family protein n=1 Tax=Paenibacillus TaxID=44249 RepID=UPI0015E8429F|nr:MULTISPECIES: hydantoinase/oxoprolinase family protein [unclassified Paenibacillus]
MEVEEYIVAVDTGGTFTDCVIVNSKGQVTVGKSHSTPPDFSEGVLESVRVTAEKIGLTLEQLLPRTIQFIHGTTVTTNAMVERRGVKVGFLTTVGHKDVLHMMRIMGRTAGMPVHQLQLSKTSKPEAIVPKQLIEEVYERVDYKGNVIAPLDLEHSRKAIQRLLDQDVKAIAISLLWSFKNPEHEQILKKLVKELAPEMTVSLSSEIVPKIGEYERSATTVINSYTSPLLSGYVNKLYEGLSSKGLKTQLLIMQSIGGLMPANEAERLSVTTLMSGPAGGVMGAKFLGNKYGHANVICTDVGGTTFDVGLVVNGEPVISSTTEMNQYTLSLPMIDIVSIGAGGGSIAKVDVGSTLLVGPDSAGARPGPVCYGKGGTEPTVTDADVVLGFIDPDYFLDGKVKLYKDKAVEAIREKIAIPLGLSVEDAAAGIVEIANSHMADLIRKMSIERGYDPRDFIIYLYGGAGPTHGTAYGRDLGVKEMIVPLGETAAVYSAFGISSSDISHVYEISDPAVAPWNVKQVQDNFLYLEDKAITQLLEENVKNEHIRLDRWVEMRYKGQVHQVDVPFPSGAIHEQALSQVVVEFESRYETLYGKGSAFKEGGIELVSYRVNAYGKLPKPSLEAKTANEAEQQLVITNRSVYWKELGGYRDTTIYRGNLASYKDLIAGPSVIELPTTTIPVYPGQTVQVDSLGSLIIHNSVE